MDDGATYPSGMFRLYFHSAPRGFVAAPHVSRLAGFHYSCVPYIYIAL